MDKLKQDLWHLLAQHGARAITSSATAGAIAKPSVETRAPNSVICCDLTLNADTLMRVTGAMHSNAPAQ